MSQGKRAAVVARRDVVLGSAAASALLGLLGIGAQAQQGADATAATTAPPAQVTWQEAMRAVAGDAQPAEGRIKIELPETAENGNVVPFTVSIESAMTEEDCVKAVHLFSTGNPKPDIASAYFTLLSGKAVFSSRLRLGRTQDIVALAEMGDGKLYMTKRHVKVTIGGCGTG